MSKEFIGARPFLSGEGAVKASPRNLESEAPTSVDIAPKHALHERPQGSRPQGSQTIIENRDHQSHGGEWDKRGKKWKR
jgi:hypothetical protein